MLAEKGELRCASCSELQCCFPRRAPSGPYRCTVSCSYLGGGVCVSRQNFWAALRTHSRMPVNTPLKQNIGWLDLVLALLDARGPRMRLSQPAFTRGGEMRKWARVTASCAIIVLSKIDNVAKMVTGLLWRWGAKCVQGRVTLP